MASMPYIPEPLTQDVAHIKLLNNKLLIMLNKTITQLLPSHSLIHMRRLHITGALGWHAGPVPCKLHHSV